MECKNGYKNLKVTFQINQKQSTTLKAETENMKMATKQKLTTATTAKSLQSCPTLCDPIPGILQARTLGWVAISFSNAEKWKWSHSVMSDSSHQNKTIHIEIIINHADNAKNGLTILDDKKS